MWFYIKVACLKTKQHKSESAINIDCTQTSVLEMSKSANFRHFDCIELLCLNPFFLFCKEPFDFQGSHTTAACTSDRLSVPLVLDVTCRKDTLDASLCSAGYGDDVTIFVCVQLIADESGSGFMPNGVEKTIDGKIFIFTREHVLDAETVKKVAVSFALGSDCVPKDSLITLSDSVG